MKTKYKLNQKPHENKISDKFLKQILIFTFLEDLYFFQNIFIKRKKCFESQNHQKYVKICDVKTKKGESPKEPKIILLGFNCEIVFNFNINQLTITCVRK